MYKLLLVDDEADVREGVLREIAWEAHGFEVVDVAENGREALELADRWEPDVVVTDIRMPFMDGLQLAEHLRHAYPAVKIIILTGFDEFEYARKAIHLQVEEFVLKPFSADELLQALHKVKGRLDEEMAVRENIDTLREHYRRSLPLLREVFLGTLVTRKLSERDIKEKIEHYGLALEGSFYTVSVLQLDTTGSGASHPDEATPGKSLRESRDFELQSFAVRNIAEEIIERREAGYVFQHNDRVVVLAVWAEKGCDPDLVRESTLSMLEEVRQSVDKCLKLTVTIGTGAVISQLLDVKYAYDDAVAALDYRMLLGSNRVISIEDVESRHSASVRMDELQEQSLLRCLKVGSVAEMEEIVNHLFDPFLHAEQPVSYANAQLFLLQLATTMLRAAQDTDGGPAVSANLLKELTQFGSLRGAKEWVVSTCAAMMGRIAAGRQGAYHSLVEEARQYTKANFADSEINISKVCAHLHISSGYFSGIFKRETKMTYMAYLLHIRMEAAMELLRTTDLKTFEIAEKVGYADPNYFSFSFKKHVGQSPKEYRSRSEGDTAS